MRAADGLGQQVKTGRRMDGAGAARRGVLAHRERDPEHAGDPSLRRAAAEGPGRPMAARSGLARRAIRLAQREGGPAQDAEGSARNRVHLEPVRRRCARTAVQGELRPTPHGKTDDGVSRVSRKNTSWKDPEWRFVFAE